MLLQSAVWMHIWSHLPTHQQVVWCTINLSLSTVGSISLTVICTFMANSTLQLFVATKLVTVLDRTLGMRLQRNNQWSQTKHPVLIFQCIPFMWTVAFIQLILDWLWLCWLIHLCIHYIHNRPSRTNGSLMPPIPFFSFFSMQHTIYVHMDCCRTFLDFNAARNKFWP